MEDILGFNHIVYYVYEEENSNKFVASFFLEEKNLENPEEDIKHSIYANICFKENKIDHIDCINGYFSEKNPIFFSKVKNFILERSDILLNLKALVDSLVFKKDYSNKIETKIFSDSARNYRNLELGSSLFFEFKSDDFCLSATYLKDKNKLIDIRATFTEFGKYVDKFSVSFDSGDPIIPINKFPNFLKLKTLFPL